MPVDSGLVEKLRYRKLEELLALGRRDPNLLLHIAAARGTPCWPRPP